ncbi:MAG: DoxX family protein [Nitrosopumilaceae archaeon]|nr:DoxX family protein [Nitrosopumilaceae archaeon]
MASAEIRQLILHDITHFGLRFTVGVIFIAHSLGKFQPGFAGFLESQGIPPEMQIPIALAELVPGILLIVGALTRISASLLSIVMLGAIFLIKGAASLTGDGGVEFDLILLAACLIVIVIGPGKISLSYAMKKIPRVLQ